MAVFYVSSLADGTGNGTTTATSGTNGAWTFAQMISATPSAGDEIRIMADGVYTRSTTATVAFANGTNTANILVTGANSSGVVDGTRATIRATASGVTCINYTNGLIRTEYLIFDGNNQTTSTGLIVGGSYHKLRYCKFINTTSYGLNATGSNNVWMMFCEATGCSGTGAFYLGTSLHGFACEAYGNTCAGFRMASTNAQLTFCASYNNSGGSGYGYLADSIGYFACNCIAYNNGNSGFDFSGNGGYSACLINCLSEGNGGAGFYGADNFKDGVFLMNCGGYNNSGGQYDATKITHVFNFINNTTGTFFNGAASGDFSLNNLTNQGALARGAGFPGPMPRGLTTGYNDIGVVQHQDAGGSTIAIPARPITSSSWNYVG